MHACIVLKKYIKILLDKTEFFYSILKKNKLLAWWVLALDGFRGSWNADNISAGGNVCEKIRGARLDTLTNSRPKKRITLKVSHFSNKKDWMMILSKMLFYIEINIIESFFLDWFASRSFAVTLGVGLSFLFELVLSNGKLTVWWSTNV